MFSSLSVWTPAFPAGHVTATDLLTCKDWRIAGVVPIAVTLTRLLVIDLAIPLFLAGFLLYLPKPLRLIPALARYAVSGFYCASLWRLFDIAEDYPNVFKT
ncbi:hypothetical protein ACHAOS_001365 [Klebsiella aerogenes]|uniref:hypothetical protein n=1 Tax=Klebsiella aerogenes TaxID=548 RepID=UPI000B33B2D4|nr:hypothetical protein [Klebsiella aerogenes]EKZ6148279.1 hypothetical protein [Klebsiella aerogenes]EKZ6283591.1 hypothetical protein [Klebsiella aerogenes]HBW3047456.1 hypothetical protein [Klebsiella aerogenes]HCD1877786.1 hypothetical protein [Klebsiella aerogenes]HCW3469326.1 hypothetical protein [Klebsiella aerogenes]